MRVALLVSLTLTACFVMQISQVWSRFESSYQPDPGQLVSKRASEHFLERHWEATGMTFDEAPQTLPTGCWIQSLNFVNATDVHVSGFVWQKYQGGIFNLESRGFLFPDAVDEPTVREVYRERGKDVDLIGWHFEATLRQPFSYETFPVDHKTLKIRIWRHDFDHSIVLTPDVDAFAAHGMQDIFGIAPDLILNNWSVDDTFFDYEVRDYGTDFGFKGFVGTKNWPELTFNVVLKRQVWNSVGSGVMILGFVALLGFIMVLTIVREEPLHGFSTQNVLAIASGLLFTVVLTHIHLRETVGTGGFVYFESLYIVMESMILVLAVLAYAQARGTDSAIRRSLRWKGGVLPLSLYWPALTGAMVVVTWWLLPAVSA